MRASKKYFACIYHAPRSKIACVLHFSSRPPQKPPIRLQSSSTTAHAPSSRPPPPGYRSMPKSSSQRFDKQSSGYVLLIVPITTFALGCWQVQRLQWKENLIETMKIRGAKLPVELPQNLDRVEDALEYQKVRVRGRFDHARETLIRPRLMLEETGAGLVSSGVKVGSFVVTPFVLTDGPHSGKMVLVNRGWVPKAREDPATRQLGQTEGEIELVGLLRKSEGGKWLVNNSKGAYGEWQRRDVQAMSNFFGSLPIFLDALRGSTVKDGPMGGQTHIQVRNNHLQYIVTWWGLSLLTAILWHRKFYLKKNFLR